MKNRVKQILSIILVGLIFSTFIPTTIWANESLLSEYGPINPSFTDYQSNLESEILNTNTIDGYSKGYAPAPLARIDESESLTLDAAASFPATYDLRSSGRLTTVRHQGNFNSCWTFSSLGSLESYLKTKETVDLSENNLMLNHGFDYSVSAGGNSNMALAYLSRWSGPVSESSDPYGSSKKTGLSPIYHLQSAEYLPRSETAIKQAIIDGGALDTSIYSTAFDYDNYYNKTTAALYYNGTNAVDHAVAIVGWDDNYSRDNFSTPPPGNGAWIMRNSWGSDWGENGYFYLSYYDSYAANEVTAFHSAESTKNYNRIYQYDPLGNTSTRGYNTPDRSGWGANVFTAAANERLTAVSTYAVSPNTTVDIKIYSNLSSTDPTSGQLMASQSENFTNAGYYTVNLNTPVNLRASEKFSVVIKYIAPQATYAIPVESPLANYSSGASANTGESFISAYGSGNWTDVGERYDANVCIKAFTGDAIASSLESLSITQPANKLIYTIGESLDISGLEVTGTYSDGSQKKETITAQNITGFDSSSANSNQVLTISIGGKTTSYTVKIQSSIQPSVNCYYHTHIQNIGWQDTRKNGELSGTSGLGLRLEAIQIKVDAPGYDLGIEYVTHVQNFGWLEWANNGGASGTSGYGYRLEAIMIRLTGSDADLFDVYYRTHVQNMGWLNWANNGEKSGTAGYGYRLEGIEIIVSPKNILLYDLADETDTDSSLEAYIEVN